jgi:ribose transport system ATP-binding protein
MAESRTGAAGDLRPAAEVPAAAEVAAADANAGMLAAAVAAAEESAEVPIGVVALRLRGFSKTFPGVRALTAVEMDVAAGSVHALVGHNGSGKSTLIKCLAGVHAPDPGAQAWLAGEALMLGDPDDAERKGLRFVHQDLGIIPELSAMDNVGFVLGFERGRLGRISWGRQSQRTSDLLAQFGFTLDPRRPLGEASPPERAAVAIVRAVAGWQAGRGVLVLDEPTAALPAHEVDRLFQLIREVSASGTAVILVSHRLDEVMAIADSVTVLRDGAKVWDGPLAATTLQRLVDLIADTDGQQARPQEQPQPRRQEQAQAQPRRPALDPVTQSTPAGPVGEAAVPALEIRDLHGRYLRGINLTVGRGELVGVAGLLGSGREELPYIVAGASTEGVTGTVAIGGVPLGGGPGPSIGRAQALGVALVPADRAAEGIFAGFTTTENVSLAALPALRRRGFVRPARERRFGRAWLSAVHADPGYGPRPISTLSGGSQQKAVLARALSVSPRLLVLSEPTAGVDIGARTVLYDELRRRVAEGLAVLMASSDLEDLLACCDRVIAVRDGAVAGEFTGARMTKAAIAYAMEGAHHEQH